MFDEEVLAQDECPECGEHKDWPREGCQGHPTPTIAQFIIGRIEADLNNRRGFHVDTFPEATRWNIRAAWLEIIRSAIGGSAGNLME